MNVQRVLKVLKLLKAKKLDLLNADQYLKMLNARRMVKKKNLEGCAACRRRISQPGELSITVIRPVECV